MRPQGDPPLRGPHRVGAGGLQRLLTVDEVAEFLQVHPKTVLRLVRSDDLPCLRLRSRLRFDPADVVRWVSARKEG